MVALNYRWKLGRLAGLLCPVLVCLSALAAGSAEDSPVLSVGLMDGMVRLAWEGGRPSYQLQISSRVEGPWSRVGSPTTEASALLPLADGPAFYRVVADFTAQYRVVFDASWSQATHPSQWPANAHFSGLVGGTHNGSVRFYRVGEAATEGIRLMAERGSKTTLLSEVAAATANGTVQFQLSGGGIGSSPGRITHDFEQPMRRDYPLVTLVTMIAPSPDWFVGVDSLSLLEDDRWVASKVVTLYGMDAGTDSGVSYSSPDQVTTPRGGITEFSDFPALVGGVLVPFGAFTFTRLD